MVEHISIIQHNINNGVTEPKYALTDDKKTVVVKTFNGPEGNRILFNEYVCYRMANLIDLPMPLSGVCVIDKETVDMNNSITSEQFGFGFYSTYLDKSIVLNDNIINLIDNIEDFYKLILFDHVIFNTDRNAGNLLVQYRKGGICLKVIDHSHVFINQAIWDSSCLKRGVSERDYLSTKILDYNHYLYNMFFRHLSPSKEKLILVADVFRNKLNEKSLQKIIHELPDEWRLPYEDEEALIDYLLYRIKHIKALYSLIFNHWIY